MPLALGAVAVLAARSFRLGAQLPGHDGLIWMLGLVLARLASSNRVGGALAGAGGLVADLALGHPPTTGAGLVLAGAAVDALLAAPLVPLLARIVIAAAIGNAVVLAVKLAAGDLPKAVATKGLPFAIETYVGFGAAAGVALAIAVLAAKRGMRATERRAG